MALCPLYLLRCVWLSWYLSDFIISCVYRRHVCLHCHEDSFWKVALLLWHSSTFHGISPTPQLCFTSCFHSSLLVLLFCCVSLLLTWKAPESWCKVNRKIYLLVPLFHPSCWYTGTFLFHTRVSASLSAARYYIPAYFTLTDGISVVLCACGHLPICLSVHDRLCCMHTPSTATV